MSRSDQGTERHDRPVVRLRTIRLRVIRGPDAGLERTLSAEGTTLIGTSPTCAFQLTDRGVSRRHLSVEQTKSGALVRDLGSTNGTLAGGVELREAVIPLDVPIAIGESQLVFVDGESEATREAPEADRVETFGRFVGRTAVMRRMFELANRLAASDISVLIEGESGTGKEVLAEEIHAHSARASGPLNVFDARADDPQLAAITLFGAAPGVWPGAPEGRPGLLETTGGGTLILDEPVELLPDLQRRLARALTRKEIQRVGGADTIPLDVRVLSTSTADLDRAVEHGVVREDLFHALVGARIEIPTLRSRPADIPLLIRAFWKATRTGEAPDALISRLVAQPWAGNVRELENAVARHLASGELEVWAGARQPTPEQPAADPLEFVGAVLDRRLPLVAARQEVVARFERLYVERVLRENGGNVTRAARASGLAHRYFQMLKARRRA